MRRLGRQTGGIAHPSLIHKKCLSCLVLEILQPLQSVSSSASLSILWVSLVYSPNIWPKSPLDCFKTITSCPTHSRVFSFLFNSCVLYMTSCLSVVFSRQPQFLQLLFRSCFSRSQILLSSIFLLLPSKRLHDLLQHCSLLKQQKTSRPLRKKQGYQNACQLAHALTLLAL